MIPMSIMIQKQRLKLFGHIVRMNDDRDIKKVLFGEIEGTRLKGKPATQWIDNIVNDLRDFGLSENPNEEWNIVKELIGEKKRKQSLSLLNKVVNVFRYFKTNEHDVLIKRNTM